MPLYDYKCQSCSHVFEGIARVNDPTPPCAKCQNPTKIAILTAPKGRVQTEWNANMSRAQTHMRQSAVPPGTTAEDVPRLLAEAEAERRGD